MQLDLSIHDSCVVLMKGDIISLVYYAGGFLSYLYTYTMQALYEIKGIYLSTWNLFFLLKRCMNIF